jgi:hypothetical protein
MIHLRVVESFNNEVVIAKILYHKRSMGNRPFPNNERRQKQDKVYKVLDLEAKPWTRTGQGVI